MKAIAKIKITIRGGKKAHHYQSLGPQIRLVSDKLDDITCQSGMQDDYILHKGIFT